MKIRRNILLFKLNNLFGELWPLAALAVVYLEQITGSYAFAFGVFSITGIAQSLFEIPTGIISDRVGRRKTMIMSSFLYLISFINFALAANSEYASLLLISGAAISGIAGAFLSGTDDAMMYETMQELGKEDEYDIIYAKSKAFGQMGLAAGALIAAGVTYFYSLNTLAWVSVFIRLPHLFMTFFFVEPKKHTQEETTSLKHFTAALKEIWKNKKLQILALIQMFHRGTNLTTHRLESAYFNTLIPTWMVNIARVIKQITGIISFTLAPYVRKFGFYKILITSSIGMFIIKGTAVVLNNFSTPFIMSFVNIFYGTSSTAESALLQKELSQKQRATMGSMVSLLGGILMALIYYVAGLIADMTSVYFAIILLILSNVLVSGGYYWMLKKYK